MQIDSNIRSNFQNPRGNSIPLRNLGGNVSLNQNIGGQNSLAYGRQMSINIKPQQENQILGINLFSQNQRNVSVNPISTNPILNLYNQLNSSVTRNNKQEEKNKTFKTQQYRQRRDEDVDDIANQNGSSMP